MAPYSAWKEFNSNVDSIMATFKDEIEIQAREKFIMYTPLCFRNKTERFTYYQVKVYINWNRMILVNLKQVVDNPADVTVMHVEAFELPPKDN